MHYYYCFQKNISTCILIALVSLILCLEYGDARKIKSKRLEKYNVDPNAVTVSGFSSGGAQAMQVHFAFSSRFVGVGIFSGVPYLYGYGRKRVDFYVTEPDQFNISSALEAAKKYEDEGLIDPLENMKKSKVYIYHGTKDSTVYHGSGKAIQKFYLNLCNSSNMFAHLDVMPAEHGMPSDNSGGPCGTINLLNHLVNNCKYNGVFEMFNYLYGGNLNKPEGTVGTVPFAGEFFSFDQTEFFPEGNSKSKTPSMDNTGYGYIPSGCSQNARNPCKLAFVLHGCEQPRQLYGDKFAKTTGYLEMAELNNIVLILPQTKRSFFNPRNPSGCWDWMGFTGNEYATKKGLQVQAIKRMMERVLGEDA